MTPNRNPIPYSPQLKNIIRILERQGRHGYKHKYGELDLVMEIAKKLQLLEILLGIAEEHRHYEDYHRYAKRIPQNQQNLEMAIHEYEHALARNGAKP